jgi:hypothetical protein
MRKSAIGALARLDVDKFWEPRIRNTIPWVTPKETKEEHILLSSLVFLIVRADPYANYLCYSLPSNPATWRDFLIYTSGKIRSSGNLFRFERNHLIEV